MKKRKRALFLAAVFVLGLLFFMRPRYEPDRSVVVNREDFFAEFAPLAQEVGKKYDLYPSVILAQAAVESNFGASELSREYNNYFGIKGKGVVLPTIEMEGERQKNVQDGFRTYESARKSFYDYGKLIHEADRYRAVREAKNAESYARALYPAGYSTNPHYGDILLKTIKMYNLQIYDEK
ncbi:MAG: glucosaminidase domain-containing protein [Peptoniphilus sp.]|nr:glucosaminidase domain-containing protein [Peptoniphilus sp.]MDY3118266.1 glucosaminidase domain-containing protein [Peptoniphilus sp.]